MRFLTEKTYRITAQLFMFALAIVALFTFKDYGVSWDEEIQNLYGQAVVNYYASGLADHGYNQIFNLYLYGGMFDGLAALINDFTPFDVYYTRHLLNAIFGLLGIFGTWRLGRLIGGYGVGLVAMALLALTPMYYGHMFNNPKDIPFAAGIVWTIYYMVRTLSVPPQKVSARLIVTLGVIMGLTLGERVGGVMLLGFWSVIVLIVNRKSLADVFKLITPIILIAYIIMLVCWPWAQENPILNPLSALLEFSNFPQDVEVLLDGTTYRSTELPWTYLPIYFGVQLPLLVIVLTLAGVSWMPFMWKDFSHKNGRQAGLILILLMTFFPTIYAIMRKPALYDAVRHFIFVLPLISVISAVAAKQIMEWVRPLKFGPPILAFLLILLTGYHVNTMIKLHPYEYIYMNSLQGGVAGAYGHYELDYWGSSFKEAADELQKFVDKEGGVPKNKIYKVAVCGPWSSAMIYLPPENYEAVYANDLKADFFISTTRWGCQDMRIGKEILRIERMDAPLSIVKDCRSGGCKAVNVDKDNEEHP